MVCRRMRERQRLLVWLRKIKFLHAEKRERGIAGGPWEDLQKS